MRETNECEGRKEGRKEDEASFKPKEALKEEEARFVHRSFVRSLSFVRYEKERRNFEKSNRERV